MLNDIRHTMVATVHAGEFKVSTVSYAYESEATKFEVCVFRVDPQTAVCEPMVFDTEKQADEVHSAMVAVLAHC